MAEGNERPAGPAEEAGSGESAEVLVARNRRETLGRLAAGVAHEINNPAAFILLGLDVLERQLASLGVARASPGAAPAFELLEELRASVTQIVALTRELRRFANPPEGDTFGADVALGIEAALSITRGSVVERAELRSRVEGSPVAALDPGRLAHLLVGLLVAGVELLSVDPSGERWMLLSAREAGEEVEIGLELPVPGRALEEELLPLVVPRLLCEAAGGSLAAERSEDGEECRLVARLPAAPRRA